ncbi:MAG: hypothetical protein RB296_09850 [Acidobacteriota bacterium]|jgi:hypothetical protein|nr:hypothetical protein [Acidobacteriota bacterium]
MNSEVKPQENELYKLVYWGELRSGHDRYSVKAKLASRFQVSEKEADALFSGAPILILDQADYPRAMQVSREFEQAGAVCRMLRLHETPVPPPPPHTQRRDDISPAPEVVSSAPAIPSSQVFAFRTTENEKKSSRKIGLVLLGLIVVAFVGFHMLSISRSQQGARQIPFGNSPDRGTSDGMSTYSDPKGYYSIRIPGGYRLQDGSAGNRSKRTFQWSSNVTLTIIASPMQREWQPEEEMMRRLDAIQGGRAGALSAYTVENYGLVAFNGLEGYEILMKRGSEVAHAYALVTPGNVAFSVAIVDSGSRAGVDHGQLSQLVRNSLSPAR